ncbi:MAG: response regulator, partial [Bacteroidota bacterium]
MQHPQHLPPYRLFLIEDSPAEVRLIQEAVKEAGLSDLIEFEYAYDGEEACELLDEAKITGKKYDLVLLDLNLP